MSHQIFQCLATLQLTLALQLEKVVLEAEICRLVVRLFMGLLFIRKHELVASFCLKVRIEVILIACGCLGLWIGSATLGRLLGIRRLFGARTRVATAKTLHEWVNSHSTVGSLR